MNYFIGLPEWRHPDWYAEGRNPQDPLRIYARHFSSVEGNTTFYALPNPSTVQNWLESAPEHFRFCFKFPRTITHDARLRHCSSEVTEFIDRLIPLAPQTGMLWLQMSHTFTPDALPVLKSFIETLPDGFHYGIEVRNPGFFSKDDTERQFNRLLVDHNINRVMFDTRALFANPASDPLSQESLKKKPRLITRCCVLSVHWTSVLPIAGWRTGLARSFNGLMKAKHPTCFFTHRVRRLLRNWR